MKVVIVTYNWPPRNAIGTHRPYSWARYWSEKGADVIVLTALKHQFDAPLDLELPVLPGVEVIEVPYGTAPGLANVILKSDSVRRAARLIKSIISRRSSFALDPRKAWWASAKEVADSLAPSTDVVVSTFGPSAAHLVAYRMKQTNSELRWVADYRDLWSLPQAAPGLSAAAHDDRVTELATVGQSADLITAVSDDMASRLSAFLSKPAICVPNGFDLDESALRSRMASIRRQPNRPFRIVHTGTLYDGSRDPAPLLQALVELKDAGAVGEGEITVDFYGSRVGVAQKLAHQSLFKPFIRLMGHVTRQDALAAQCSADLLLLLESSAPEARGVLTGKLFEYMASGRPILSVGSLPEFDVGRVLTLTGTGQTFGPDQYVSIARAVGDSFHGRGLLESYSPRLDEIMAFSRERIALNLYDRILSNA